MHEEAKEVSSGTPGKQPVDSRTVAPLERLREHTKSEQMLGIPNMYEFWRSSSNVEHSNR